LSVHLRNFNRQHLILAKFYVHNKTPIGNQSAKFQPNLPKQTIVAAAFVRSPQTLQFRVFVYGARHKDLKLKCLGMTSQKPL